MAVQGTVALPQMACQEREQHLGMTSHQPNASPITSRHARADSEHRLSTLGRLHTQKHCIVVSRIELYSEGRLGWRVGGSLQVLLFSYLFTKPVPSMM